MKKVSRDLLKGLVKECLIELLAEGLSADTEDPGVDFVNEVRKPRASAKKRNQPTRRSAADLMSVGQKSPKESGRSKVIENRIRQASGGNSVMESILRDTAANTLPTMLAAESKNSDSGMLQRVARGDTATKVMAQSDPMDIFEGSSNWASLAFAGKIDPSDR